MREEIHTKKSFASKGLAGLQGNEVTSNAGARLGLQRVNHGEGKFVWLNPEKKKLNDINILYFYF